MREVAQCHAALLGRDRLPVETEDDNVVADATELHQVIMNLSTNAAHAMRQRADGSLYWRPSC